MKKLFKNKKFLMALAILPIGTIAFLLYRKFSASSSATTGAAGSSTAALPAGSTVAGTGSAPLSSSLTDVGTGSGGGSSGTPATNTTTPPPAGSPDETPYQATLASNTKEYAEKKKFILDNYDGKKETAALNKLKKQFDTAKRKLDKKFLAGKI